MTDEDLPPVELDEGLAGISEVLSQIREVVVGYRATLLADDFSETAAEAMSVAVHNSVSEMMFAMMLKNVLNPSPEEPS